jgi:hypothetical protein
MALTLTTRSKSNVRAIRSFARVAQDHRVRAIRDDAKTAVRTGNSPSARSSRTGFCLIERDADETKRCATRARAREAADGREGTSLATSPRMKNATDNKSNGRKIMVAVATIAASMAVGWCAARATNDRQEQRTAVAQPPAVSAPVVTENVAPVPTSATTNAVAEESAPSDVTRAPPPQDVAPVIPAVVQRKVAIAKRPRAKQPVAALPPLPRPVCTAERGCDTTDLQRCLAHDGEGCASVGRYYEVERADPFASVTWYRKGCELSNDQACNALERVKSARPREGAMREDPLAASMPVM